MRGNPSCWKPGRSSRSRCFRSSGRRNPAAPVPDPESPLPDQLIQEPRPFRRKDPRIETDCAAPGTGEGNPPLPSAGGVDAIEFDFGSGRDGAFDLRSARNRPLPNRSSRLPAAFANLSFSTCVSVRWNNRIRSDSFSGSRVAETAANTPRPTRFFTRRKFPCPACFSGRITASQPGETTRNVPFLPSSSIWPVAER